MATRDQDDWIRRILGVDVAALAGPAADAPDQADDDDDDTDELDSVADAPSRDGYGDVLARRLGDSGDRVAALAAQGADADGLGKRLDAIARLIEDDPDSAEEHLAEVDRLLFVAEVDQAAAAIPPAARPPLLLRKLVAEWRAAQDLATSNLDAIGKAFLADRDVQADPRFGEVFAAVRDLDSLLPSFGTELVDRVGAVLDGGREPAMVAAGLKAVRACRSQLDGAGVLQALEAVAAEQYGGGYAVSASLADVLDRMEGQLEELAAA